MTLNDTELRAFWIAAGIMGYPYGHFYKLVCAGGQRQSEWSDAKWKEVDWSEKTLRIPQQRLKTATTHLVPFSDLMIEVLNDIPRSTGKDAEDFIFSQNNGKSPISSFNKNKMELDRLMLLHLKSEAIQLEKDPENVALMRFTLHDLRRGLRTNFPKLMVTTEVAEAVIGHGKSGPLGIYNFYEYLDEKREALQAWADRLRVIIASGPIDKDCN